MNMLNAEIVEKLKVQAESGRGFWLGLKPRVDLAKAHHPAVELMGPEAHVTLLHLGKSMSGRDVEVVCSVMDHDISRHFAKPLKAEITGAGWFWRWERNLPVLLVNSGPLLQLRIDVMDALRQHEDSVEISDRYGFIPHITIPQATSTQIQCLTKALPCFFDTIHVICGEESHPIT